MAELTNLMNQQESFLKGIMQETKAGNNAYELMTYPKGYVGIQQNVRDIVSVGNIVGKEVGYNGDNLGKTYQKMRVFFTERIMGKRAYSLDELLDMQARNIHLLNSNLKNINDEAKEEKDNLVKYYEEICDEFSYNIVSAPERQKILKIKTNEFSTLRQKLTGSKRYDPEYFEMEKKLREVRREQSEQEHDYVMRMRDTVKLEQEKSFIDVMEQLLTKSVHLSEMYSRETEYIERHVDRTKNVYLRLIKQQGQFFMLRDGVEKLKEYLITLQRGVMKGISEMNKVVNGADSTQAVFAPNMGNLKSIVDDIRNAESQRAVEMEKSLYRNQLLK